MKTIIYIFILTAFLKVCLTAQSDNLKHEAIESGKKGNYSKAVEILEKAKAENPNDPEIYYYLGYFAHYLAYDSKPLTGYSIEYSDKVLEYFFKAIELKKDYGDAYYFIGAEYGARALKALQDNNIELCRLAYKKSYEYKAFPDWLMEYGKNILQSCDSNGILFVGGDAEFNPIQYLQLDKKYRKDITVIPTGLINRPWFVEKLLTGVDGVLKSVSFTITKEQINDMHPYKWDTLQLEIPISEKLKNEFKLSVNETFRWKVSTNLKAENRSYLDAGTAILINIIEANKWERPIHFSLGCNPTFYSGLSEYLQISGIAYKLFPFNVEENKYKINPGSISELLLNKENIKYFKDVNKHNMPRISGVLINYLAVLFRLAIFYKEQNQSDKIIQLVEYVNRNMPVENLPQGKNIMEKIEKLR